MAQKDRLDVVDVEPSRSRQRSKSPSSSQKKKDRSTSRNAKPSPEPLPLSYQEPQKTQKVAAQDVDTGVKDNDIFMLPSSDYTILIGLTIVAVVVRLFKIYQPSSVVFDEVQ